MAAKASAKKEFKIPADAIYQIRMLMPRIVNTVKTDVGDLVDVFAGDAKRFVDTDKHAVYDPPLDVQQEALSAAAK